MRIVENQIILRILPSTTGANSISGDVLYLKGISLPSEVDGDVYLTSQLYKAIFGKSKKSSSNSQKRLSIVKISANGHSIHRAYKSTSAANFTNDYAAMTTKSIEFLTDSNGSEPQVVKLSKGSYFLFYWSHPDIAIRLSFKLGLLSVILGLLSIILTCLHF